MKILKDVHLDAFTTFKVGGPAKYFVEVSTVDELSEIMHRARKEKSEVFVLGAGSNILISDEGFYGYVIRINIKGVEVKDLGEGNFEVIVGAGENWDSLVEFTVNKGLWGIENLSLIPGSIGGAVVQNIGAYGVEIKETVHWVEIFDFERGVTDKLMVQECNFDYRDSIFKSEEGTNYIVTRVSFLLSEKGKPVTKYKDIKKYLEKNKVKNPTLDEIRRIIIGVRRKKFPSGKRFGSAGSFFINPVISRFRYAVLKWRYPELSGYKNADGIKVSASWIIDHVCRLKNLRVGNVSLYKNQPLVIVTDKDSSATDVKRLSELVQKEVYRKTKIKLKTEVTFVGF